MVKWYDTPIDTLKVKAKNIIEILQLPLMNEILEQIYHKTKYKVMKNNIMSKVPKKARDKVLGLLIKNPGIMARRYN